MLVAGDIGAVLLFESGEKRLLHFEGRRAILPAEEPMTEDTVFDAASLTKVVATLPCVMKLIETGKIELEAEVRRYIPEMRAAITVRHLLTHTSGLRPGIPREPAWSGYDTGIAKATALEPEVERCDHSLNKVTPSGVTCLLCGETMETP